MTAFTYMDGQPVMLWDLVTYANDLRVVSEIYSGKEDWVVEYGFPNGFMAIANFVLGAPHTEEDLLLLCRLTESEAMSILSPRADRGGSLCVGVAKAKTLILKKGITFEDGQFEPKY